MRLCRLILIAGLLGIGAVAAGFAARYPAALFLAVILIGYLGGRKAVQLTSHGTARWATAADLKRAGMFGGHGLPLGRVSLGRPSFWASLAALFDRRVQAREACLAFMPSMRRLQRAPPPEVVRLNDVVHVAVFAPAGAGKSTGLVIPFLLDCPDSCVVVDFKGELARATAEHRRRVHGQRTVFLDPFKVMTANPDTFEPLEQIDRESEVALDDCRALAEAIVLRTGDEKEPHWNDSSETWIGALVALAVRYAEGPERTLQFVREMLTNPAKMRKAIELLCKSEDWDGMLARMGHQPNQLADRELGSVLTTANRHMRFLDTLAIAASTKASSFDPAELRGGKMTVYLILPPEHMRAQSSLLRMWIGSMLRSVVKGGLQERNKVHFVCDEAAALGRFESLEDAVDKFRGYGVRMQFYYQSVGQLKKCWREGQDITLLSNTSQCFFGVNDPQTADYVSNRLGEATIVVDSGNSNTGGSTGQSVGSQSSQSAGRSWGATSSWQAQGRKLLKPEEVTQLPQRVAITFTPGVPPIRTWMLRYFEETWGNAQSRWRRMRASAELWATSLGMVTLAAVLVWFVTR